MYIGIETTAIAIPPAYQITSASDSTSKSLMVSITLPSNHHLFNKPSCPSTAWSTKLEKKKIHEFSPKVQPGPTISIPDSPMEIFHLFYSSDKIAQETMTYAKQQMSPEHFFKFEPITKTDLEAFFGFSILMGINPLPSIHMYWERNSWHHCLIAERISRDRFEEISRYLHVADNTTLFPPGSLQYDRLGKVRPLLEHLSLKFRSLYNPGKHLSVDEAMIKFQGRSTLKQYMPMKPTKRGIKVWVIADKNGYFSELQV